MKVTAEQVREAVQKSGKTWWKSHDCSLCGEPVGHIFDGDDVYFKSACGCSWSPNRPTTWDDVAECVNIQDKDEIAERMFAELSKP